MKTLIGSTAFSLGVLSSLPALGTDAPAPHQALTCRIAQTDSFATTRWLIELDPSIPLAMVNESEQPADYSASHVRIRMAIEGPTITIGRVTGRLLATDKAGRPLAYGACTSAEMASNHLPPTA